ncbi:LLM class flavin-dependent oxidoreductase [Micromonospora sp. NIE79]|uniref:LLM class flavin-dependent oxidoreductase n=1 Tax=Micromonospora trifolii TaxID=2911208 RepID=A0ABS9NCA3_9ACTN|nr:LLM class flavin-dependent oxidoreductase [Micromonospora trifolii]MCG5447298.1 LLM class flavin-dependent oxidoreductase [Micromonospora trifolii]
MNWGILLTTAKPDHQTEREVLKATVEYAQVAERLGYSSGWVLEHHFTRYGICPDTIALAGYLLGQTETLNIGTAVTIAPLMHPIRLAESTALLDQLSDGRFHLGLGRGSFPADFEVFKVDPTRTQDSMRQGVDLMMKAWTEERVGAEGEEYSFAPVPVYPKPHTRPHPPVYVAGESPSTVEWAAQNGFPLLLQLGQQDEETRSRVELYNQYAELAGRDPDAVEHVLVCVGHVGATREEAKKEIFGLVKWWGEEGQRDGFGIEDLRQLPNYRYHLRRIEQAALEGRDDAESWISDWLDNNPVGTAEQCAERLNEIIEASGAKHVVLAMEGSGDVEVTKKNMERFATEVFPLVKA